MRIDPSILRQLSPAVLVEAYSRGLFPMVEGGHLQWYSPDPRGLLPLDDRFHVSRRLRQIVRGGKLACTIDRAFADVIAACARRPGGTWISPEMHSAYRRLHDLGIAHSVEVWPADAVGRGHTVGGLYGVAIGGAMFAESMFHTARDAGNVAVVFLHEHLRQRGFAVWDIQWTTEHLCRFGAYLLPRDAYLREVTAAVSMPHRFD